MKNKKDKQKTTKRRENGFYQDYLCCANFFAKCNISEYLLLPGKLLLIDPVNRDSLTSASCMQEYKGKCMMKNLQKCNIYQKYLDL